MIFDDVAFDFDEEFPFLNDDEFKDDISIATDYLYSDYPSDSSAISESSGSDYHETKKRKFVDTSHESGDSNEDNHQYLLNIPKRIEICFNSGNYDNLKQLIDIIFDEACSLQTSSMLKEEKGKNKILELFITMSQSLPDIIINIKKSRLNTRRRLITTIMECSGTYQNYITQHDNSLFDLFVQQADFLNKIDEKLLKKVNDIKGRGMYFKVHAKLTWYFVLNATMDTMKKLIILYKPLEVVEVKSVFPKSQKMNVLEPQVIPLDKCQPRSQSLPSAIPSLLPSSNGYAPIHSMYSHSYTSTNVSTNSSHDSHSIISNNSVYISNDKSIPILPSLPLIKTETDDDYHHIQHSTLNHSFNHPYTQISSFPIRKNANISHHISNTIQSTLKVSNHYHTIPMSAESEPTNTVKEEHDYNISNMNASRTYRQDNVIHHRIHHKDDTTISRNTHLDFNISPHIFDDLEQDIY